MSGTGITTRSFPNKSSQMILLPRLFLSALALPALTACAAPAKPVPKALVTEEQPSPLPGSIKPLTVEQDEQIME